MIDSKDQSMFVSPIIDDDAEFIPILTDEDEDLLSLMEIPNVLPILPLRNTVLFPGVVIPITVGRDKSIALIKKANKGNKLIGVVAQKDATVEDPELKDLCTIGTVALIIKMLQMPDGNTTIIIQGKRRFALKEIVKTEPYMIGEVELLEEIKPKPTDKEFQALVSTLKETSLEIITNTPNIPQEASFAIKNIENYTFLINFIANNNNVKVEDKQKILETPELKQRAILTLEHLTKELQMLELRNQIQTKVRVDMDQQQKEYFLNQQLKQIQQELGQTVEVQVDELNERAKTKKWSKTVEEKFNKEMMKLQRMNPNAAEYSLQVNYVETLVDLPWEEYTEDKFNLKKAQSVLDRDHFGLEKVKERIIEYLAVLKLKGNMKSPILCFYGPPGVGKTSLGKSIAEALGRKYVRMSLGGIRDEAEIRGHRKTYIGAMPGRIIKNLHKAGSSNPVFVLDEIDKLGNDHHGDPSSALLEVLDPEQNVAFSDNFLEVDYDLSHVMFIATANNLSNVQPALLDRMEIIDITGYIMEEKIEIAKHHLIPRQLEAHGIKADQINLSKQVIERIIDGYTRESGVRALDKVLAKVFRQTAKSIVMEEAYSVKPTIKEIEKILGVSHFGKDHSLEGELVGVVTGLAWTATGGELLYIESSLSKGKGLLNLTGNLGDVMKESAIIALEYIKSRADHFAVPILKFEENNIHIHVPEGAIPKDGPSAGITMLTAILSTLTSRKVKKELAMTGEITLRGKVLPVGGIKEKILAAKRSGIKTIILSEQNRKDIEDIKPLYIKGVEFIYVKEMQEVIDNALI